MSLKRVLSYMTAAGTVVSVFGGMQIGASAAADSVTFRDRDASEQTVLNSTWTSYDADGDNIMDVVFDDASDTITFNSDISLRSTNASGHVLYVHIIKRRIGDEIHDDKYS